MEDERVNPVVDPAESEELAAPEVEETEPVEPIAEESAGSIDRRSRRAGKKPSKPATDWTESEEYRKFQSERDQLQAKAEQLESERQRRVELERAQQERFERESQSRVEFLREVIAEADDPGERQQAIDELLALNQQLVQYGGQQYAEQLRRWEAWKSNEIKTRGLDTSDPRFNRQYSPGQQGLAEFQADLVAAENETLKKRLAEARKAADPASIAALVRKEVARLAAEQGLDTVDLSEPDRATGDSMDAWERDTALFNAGRMPAATYLKKWGGG